MEIEKEKDGPPTTYSINREDYKFHIDNLRSRVEDDYESSVTNTQIEHAMKCINPFLGKMLANSQAGPGLNYFKFLRTKKIEAMKERGIHTNCEYHYILQSSFYWKDVINTVSNRSELEKYNPMGNILVVIQIPTCSSLSKKKYDVYAKVVEK